MIRFEHVSKRYSLHRDRPRSFREMFVGRRSRQPGRNKNTLWALQDVSFEIPAGQTVGLIGPNGAGKSTTFKLISRIISPTQGQVDVRGRVAALLELGTGFHPELSGRDNIYLSGALAGMSRAEIERKFAAIVDFSELEEFLDVPVKHYSSGMFARLAFAVSIHLDPEVLLVDEVLAVGDYAFQQKCLGRISELQRAGLTICLVTHFLDTVRAMCTRALWFDHGHLRADGAAEAVVRQYLDYSTAQEARRLATSAALNPNQRWGSRKVEITRVWLADGQGREQTVFETGQPLVLHMAYHAHYPTPAPIFGMAIHRQDGLHITGPNTGFAGLELPVVEGRGEVTYTIQDLPLLDGLYQVTAAVVNQDDTETFDYHDRAYSFRVSNLGGAVKERFGLLALNGAWEHMPDAVSVPGIHPPQPSLSS